MFKKIIAATLSVSLVFALCACSQGSKVSSTSTSASASSASEGATSGEVNSLSEEDAALAAIGDVEVSNGVFTVSITLPKDYVGESTTQADLDEKKGQDYVSATLNADGSVTYKLTKAQYQETLDGIKQSIDSSIQDIVNDDTYTISAVEHNDDYTVFDVTIDGTEVGLYDSFAALGFYMYGGMYGIFSGHRVDNVTVNYRDLDGNIIQTGNSSEMGDNYSSAN